MSRSPVTLMLNADGQHIIIVMWKMVKTQIKCDWLRDLPLWFHDACNFDR